MYYSEVYDTAYSEFDGVKCLKIFSDSNQRTLHDVTFPDRGGGFGYPFLLDHGVETTRMIIWRSHTDTLDLQEFSLQTNLANNQLKIVFTGSSIVDCRIYHIDSHIYLLICTSTGVAAVRFSLSTASTTSPIQFPQRSIFSDVDDVWRKFFPVKGLQPSAIRSAKSHFYVNPHCAVFAFGISNSTLLIARLAATSPDNLEVFELSQSSIIRKLWNGLTPFSRIESDSTESIIDLVFLPLVEGEQLVASICKDHRLRLWDLKHRGCFAVVDLLDSVSCLQPGAGVSMSGSTASTGTTAQQRYAPGMCHKIACPNDNTGLHSSTGTVKQLLVYLSLTPALCTGLSVLGVDQQPFNCWVWVSLDLTKAKQWDRDCLRVDCVEPLADEHGRFPASRRAIQTGPINELAGMDGSNAEISAIDFIPFQLDNFHVWREDADDISDAKMETGESISDASPCLGIWWLAHQTNTIDTGLDSLYSVQWTSALHSMEDGSGLPRNVIAIPPYLVPHMPNTRQRCVPSLLMEEPTHRPVADDSCEAVSGEISVEKLEEFLDYIFYPGRLSGIAIASALKSLRKSYNLSCVQLASTIEELRQQLYRTLSDELLTYLESGDGRSLLKTFYFTALDMHDYGLQPLGMFCCQWETGSLSLSDERRIPFTPGLVIVRRWGFSILRPLESFERLLWSQQATSSCASVLDGTISSAVASTALLENCKVVLELSRRTSILLHHLCHHELWPMWEADLFAISNSSNSASPSRIARRILNILDETDSIYAPLSNVDVNDWRQTVFHVPLQSDHLVVFDKLITLLDSSDLCDTDAIIEELEESVRGNSNQVYNYGAPAKMSCVIVEMLGQAFRSANETRLHFAFGLLVLLVRYQIDWVGPVPTPSSRHDLFPMQLISRLHDLICRLRVLHWIACTKVRILPDPRRLMNIWEHLNLLGMRQSLTPLDNSGGNNKSLDVARLPDLFQSHLPGLTLLEQICLDWLPTDFWACDTPWVLRCSRLVGQLHAYLNPSTRDSSGHQLGLLRVVRHLLLAGRSTELVQLTDLLAGPDILNHRQVERQGEVEDSEDEHDDDDDDGSVSMSVAGWSWEGDYSLIGLCAGLANLWSGNSEAAETYFKEASNWIFQYATQITTLSKRGVAALSPITDGARQQLLVNILFPGEFSLRKLFSVSDETELMTQPVCPEEVQVRFLMKVMPVLENIDCIAELLNLAEFALNRLAQLRLLPTAEALDSEVGMAAQEGALSPSACQMSSVKRASKTGFLCGSAAFEDSPKRLALLTRLGDLEAALWTRLFKHELALGNYVRAHMLIHSNPDTDRRRDCLRQLVVALCDRGEASLLVTFQYGSLENEFLLILEARARATDVLPSLTSTNTTTDDSKESVNPYYDVLYAFHVHRSNYRAAAVVMFEHAHRLAVELNYHNTQSAPGSPMRMMLGGARILSALQRQATCLVAAINALYLVPTDHQWLIRPGTDRVEHSVDSSYDRQDDKMGYLCELVGGDWAFDEAAGDDDKSNSPQPSPLETGEGDGFTATQDKVILSLDDLVRCYTLTRASLRLARVCWERSMLRAGPQSPQDTVVQLLTLAIYDEAVRVCEAFHLDCSPIIRAVACRCADLAYFETTCSSRPVRETTAAAHFTREPGVIAGQQLPYLPALVEGGITDSRKPGDPLANEADQVLHAIRALSVTKSGRQYRADTSLGSNAHWYRDLYTLYTDLLECLLTRFKQPGSLVDATRCSTHLLAAQCLLLSNSYTSEPSSAGSPAGAVPKLPSWLTVRLMREQPVALLRVYLQANCLEASHQLAVDMLEAASGIRADPATFGLQTSLKEAESSTLRLQSGGLKKVGAVPLPVWLPHNLFARLLEALRQLATEFPACKLLHESLSKSMTVYFGRLECVCRRTFA